MRRFKLLNLIFLFLFILNSCGTVREGFQNPKKNSRDEFLVEKKSPLVIPPEFDQLPVPKDNNDQVDNTQSSFKTLVSNTEQEVDENLSNKNLEETLLDKIKK
ncbi:DUF3035 domain-containing protein [Candidatus Pelagibacter sp.]|nr:DUF3035 domain-containing protein [Candidatus Pelagibacter sp.]